MSRCYRQSGILTNTQAKPIVYSQSVVGDGTELARSRCMTKRQVRVRSGVTVLALLLPLASAGQGAAHNETSPLYRVTVVQRTVKAINYEYRSGPTKVDFRGTVLLPNAKGEATVESRQGSTRVDAALRGLAAPQRFGRAYLTYVLWAITPEGRPYNLGELVPGASDKADLHATTDLQAFALIVTAEPYSAVRKPSDVVVLENQVRPDTAGGVEPVEARYELLPRSQYTLQLPDGPDAAAVNGPKISMHAYEAVSELYQARNAVGIAGSENAARYAPDIFARAQQQLARAQALQDRKGDYRMVVQEAREAAQTAADARLIADQRQQDQQLEAAKAELSNAMTDLANARRAKQQALDEAQQAQSEAQAATEQADAALSAPPQAAPPPPPPPPAPASSYTERSIQPYASGQTGRELRVRLLADLKSVLPTLDTPRGLVVTLPDDDFRGGDVRETSSIQIASVATILARRTGLQISVEGHSDSAAKTAESRERAEAVRQLLIRNGVAANQVFASGLGDGRPVASNATPEGRKENSRVELVVSGSAIGNLALWDHPYPLAGSTQPRSGGGTR